MAQYSWIAGNGDWSSAGNWLDDNTGTNGVPSAGDTVLIGGSETVTITSSEAAAVLFLESAGTIVDDSSSFYAGQIALSAGQFNVIDDGVLTGTISVSGGALNIAAGGEILNATIVENGGQVNFASQSAFDNLVFDGVMTIDSTGNYPVYASGTLVVNDVSGQNPGVLNIFNDDQITFQNDETLNNLTINLGNGASSGEIAEGGDGFDAITLTLDDAVVLNSYGIGDSFFDADGDNSNIVNSGIINRFAGGLLDISVYSGTVTNSGVINSTAGGAIYVSGANFRNTGLINFAADSALYVYADSVVNNAAGRITLQSGSTMALNDQFTNDPQFRNLGSIVLGGGSSSSGGAIYGEVAASLFTNATSGVISGFGAIDLPNLANQGTLEASGGALSFSGDVSGSGALEADAGASLTVNGTVSATGAISGAGSVTITGNTSYIDSGATVSVANLAVTGSSAVLSLNENLSYAGNFADGAKAVVYVNSGYTLTLSGATSSFAGLVEGGGTLTLGGGATTIASGVKMTQSYWSISGAHTTVTINEALTYANGFGESAGATVTLVGGNLTLTGASSFSGGTVNGAEVLSLQGTSMISKLTIGGTDKLSVTGATTQLGSGLTLGDSSGAVATLSITASGSYLMNANSSIALGASTSSSISNAGLLEKSGGVGTSTIAANILNTKTIAVNAGVLDLKGAITGTGAQTLAANTTLELDGAVGTGQTLTFGGGDAKLALDDLDIGGADLFHGSLSNFGTGDKIDAGAPFGTGTLFNFVENAGGTSGVFSLTDGSLHASFTMNGDYAKTNFTKGTDGNGGTLFTFQA